MSDLLERILVVLRRLRDSHIHYRLRHSQDDAISIDVDVPGERWEVDFFENGDVYIEVFRSDGKIDNEKRLEELFRKHSS